jgi:hypothetical protein
MSRTEINPSWLQPRDYVVFLNQCFPGTWNLQSFAWYLRRSFGGRVTDIAVRAEGAKLLAMVAVCYRRVLAPDGHATDVGIMLAGGTLPSEQRRGHYSALMQASLEIGRGIARLRHAQQWQRPRLDAPGRLFTAQFLHCIAAR